MDQILNCEGFEDIQVAAVRGCEGDVTDKGDFFEDVLIRLAFVAAAIDDGNGEDWQPEGIAMTNENHNEHGKDPIDLTGAAGECVAGIALSRELDGEEEIGLEESSFDGGFVKEGAG